MKRCSISVVIKEIQITTTRMHHFIPTRMAIIKKKKIGKMSVGEDVEKLEPSYTAGRTIKWYSCYGKELIVP